MTQHKTDSKQLTVGEMLELAEGLKKMGVLRGKFGDFEFEFALAYSESPTKFLTPEEFDEEARKLRKEIEEEAFAAS